MDNIALITEIVSGTGCLTMAAFLHYSKIPGTNTKHLLQAGRACIVLALALLGVLSFATILKNGAPYEALKSCFIQNAAPVQIFLLLWSILFSVYDRQVLRRIIGQQLRIIILITAANLLYYLLLQGKAGQSFYYVMLGINLALGAYYTYLLRHILRKHSPECVKREASLKKRIYFEWTELCIVYVLSVLTNLYPNKIIYIAFTGLYTLLYITIALRYHNFEIRAYSAPQAEGKKENKPGFPPEAASKHTAALNNDKIAEKLSKWETEKGFLQMGITIKSLSKELGINRTYLSNFINDVYGMNFNNWINQLRVQEAKRRIHEHPATSLSDIAEDVGFADPAHFSKLFKQIEGVSPSAWKKTLDTGKGRAS